MKRRDIAFISVLVALQLFCSSLWARPRTAYEAEMVVTGWLKADPRPLGTALAPEVMMAETFTDDYGEPVYYIVYLQPSGFVIVSADDLVEPIIGFADDGIFDPSLENPLGALVTNDLNGRIAAVRSTFSVLTMTPQAAVSKTQKKWRRFISLGEAPAGGFGLMGLTSISDSDVRVAPLVETKWGQSSYYDCDRQRQAFYNYYTPPFEPGDPNNYLTGCVATAMAQLMRYHQHPATEIRVHEFTIKVDDDEQTAYTRGGDGSGGPYRWSDMVLAPDCSTSETQRKAIGALCYDAGISVGMAYSADVSSAGIRTAAEALKTVFKYSHAVIGNNWDSVSKTFRNIGPGLNGIVNPNLDAGNPVFLGLGREEGGHAVLCDGYGYNSSTLYHHLNMGWSGWYDAWYNLPTIDCDPPFNVVVECLYNIFTSDSGEIISGRVTNTVGNPMRNAAVAAQGSAGSYTAVTNSKGIYALKSLDSDSTYTITVTKSGYNFTPQDVTTEKSTDGSDVSGNKWGIDFVGLEPWRYNSMEDFEMHDFSKFPWEHAGDASWTITSRQKHFGAYSAGAGIIEDDESTTLRVTLDCASGNITFYHKVSSESDGDYLQFYIDGVRKRRWSGEENWAQMSFPVTTGTRTFEWTYSKDSSNSGGDDTVWIDDIEFPIPIAVKTAYNPDPSDGAVDVNPNVSLSWTAGFGAVTHDVYLDTDEAAVANATISSGEFKGNQSGTTYTPGPLALGTTYYWRVDEFDGLATHKGNVWSFSIPRVPDLPITDPNLMGWWKFDAGSGTTAVDWSGRDHHGTLRGNPQWVAGYDSGALQFDGFDDYVNIDGWTGILGSHAITVSAWVKTTSTVSGRASNAIVGWGSNARGHRFGFGIDDARLRTEHHGGNRQGNTNVADGQWHHVAVTVKENSTVSYPEVILFLDGQDDTIPGTDPDAYNITAGRDVSIGRRPASNDRFFDGIIDDVRIYDKALTQDQIEQIMRGDPLLAWDPQPPIRLPVGLNQRRLRHRAYHLITQTPLETRRTKSLTGQSPIIFRNRPGAGVFWVI